MIFFALYLIFSIQRGSVYPLTPLSKLFGSFDTQFHTKSNGFSHKMKKWNYFFLGDIRSKELIRIFDQLEIEHIWPLKLQQWVLQQVNLIECCIYEAYMLKNQKNIHFLKNSLPSRIFYASPSTISAQVSFSINVGYDSEAVRSV